MNKRTQGITSVSPVIPRSNQPASPSRDSRETQVKAADLLLGKELLELCSEIAGALLRGYCEGKSGRAVRKLIVTGLMDKMACKKVQAQSIVDLSLELIHFQAFGGYRSGVLELSYLIAKGGGEVSDASLN